MTNTLSVQAVYEGGMKVRATNGEHVVIFDYPLTPEEKTAGFTPLQMLMASLAACAGNTIPLLLRKMHQPIQGMEIQVKALRREEHPTILTEISIEFIFQGFGLDYTKVEEAVQKAERFICPVWSMLKASTKITSTFRIVEK
jgi:putative redox protein